LYELHLLAEMLDAAERNGAPYRLVVIDSLKAVAPTGIRVGQQEITDFVDLVDSICAPRRVTVLYVHHQSKDSDTAQGAAGLLEMVHGVFRLKQSDDGQRLFCIDKTRLDSRGNREIPYRISGNGALTVAAHAEQPDDDQGRGLISAAFEAHWQRHLSRVAHLGLTDPSRIYQGIPKSDYFILLKGSGPSHPSWRHLRIVQDIITQMVKDGELKRLKNQRVGALNSEFLPKTTTDQLPLAEGPIQTPQTADAEDSDDFSLPGW
jgi:hypothetical protein